MELTDKELLDQIVNNMTSYTATHMYQFDTDTPEPRRIPVVIGAVKGRHGKTTVFANMGHKTVWNTEINTAELPEMLYKLSRQEIKEVHP